jgi:hypothetical protein
MSGGAPAVEPPPASARENDAARVSARVSARSEAPQRILAIDQGAIHFGICLAEYDGRLVTPLFLGTAYLEPKPLADLVDKQATLRRSRRTAHEHRRRLKYLRDLLGGRGGPLATQPQLVQTIVAFAQRRGHFYGTGEADAKEAEAKGAISHQVFRVALADFLTSLLPDPGVRDRVFRICCSLLDKQSRRPMRVNARNVGVCQWAACANRRATAGVGSLVQGLSGKLRPFLEAKVEMRRVLTAERVLAVAQAVYQDPAPGPTALIRLFDTALLAGLNLPARQDAKGRPLPPEKALEDWWPQHLRRRHLSPRRQSSPSVISHPGFPPSRGPSRFGSPYLLASILNRSPAHRVRCRLPSGR